MKITCKQQDLSRGLSVVNHAVSSRSTLPILANILIATDQGRVRLSATNLEIGINYWLDAQIEDEGSITVPAKLFADFVNSLPQATVDILSSPETYAVNVKSLRSSANIKGMDPTEYPIIPSAEGSETPILLDASLLREMISQVAFASADDDSRPVLTAVYVKLENEQLTFAGADAFRVAIRNASLPGQTQNQDEILIPARTLTELGRILPAEGTVQMLTTPNRSQVLFQTENMGLVSRLIEGSFPRFQAIVPKEFTTRAVIETKEFAAAVRSVVPFARDSSNVARVSLKGETEGDEATTLTIEANAEDVGSNVSTINANVEGPEQQLIFNVKYLSEVLSVVDTPEVSLEVTTALRPGVIRPVSPVDYIYVIMPMTSNR